MNLSGANLNSAILNNIRIESSFFVKANLGNTQMFNSIIDNSDFTSATFDHHL